MFGEKLSNKPLDQHLSQLFSLRGSANEIWFVMGFRRKFFGPKGFRIEKKVEKHCSKL
jgi:hypothetical protein